MVQAIPEGVSSVVPYLCIRGAKKAIEFYQTAFGAEVVSSMPMGPDQIGHADLKIAGGRVYLADEMPQFGSVQSPKALGGTSANIHLWVEDCDAVFASAVAAGATVLMPLTDQFWGDRYGMVADPFGHVWAISTHKEDLTPEEQMRRGDEAMAHMAAQSKPAAATKPKTKSTAKEKGRASETPAAKAESHALESVATTAAKGKKAKKAKKVKAEARPKKVKPKKDKKAKRDKKEKKRKKKSKR